MISASQDFINAMKSPIKTVYLKFEIYDSQMNYIKEITQQVTKQSIGAISVSNDRPIRRSFSFSLINKNNEFDFGDQNLIWLDKRIKLYIGLLLSNENIEYVPQGVYILTSPTDSHMKDGKIATIQGQDKGFLLSGNRGKFINQLTIATGAKIVDSIRTIATEADETMFNFDENITTTVPYELTFEAGSDRWDAISELAKLAQCDIFYDVDGYLRLKLIDLNDFDNDPVQWTYTYGDSNEKFYAGNTRQLDEGSLANYILVLGGSSETATVRYELIVDENNPIWKDHPYSIQKIGTILYTHNNGNPDGLISNQNDALFRAKYELMKRLGFTEKLSVNIAPNYLHEANDMIQIEDDENSVTGKYLLTSFQIPLSPQLMTLECLKYQKVIDDWSFI